MQIEEYEEGEKKDECAYEARKMTKDDFETERIKGEAKALEQKKGLLLFEDSTYDFSSAESLPTRFVNRDEMRKKFEKQKEQKEKGK
jgi:hypothetical protein